MLSLSLEIFEALMFPMVISDAQHGLLPQVCIENTFGTLFVRFPPFSFNRHYFFSPNQDF